MLTCFVPVVEETNYFTMSFAVVENKTVASFFPVIPVDETSLGAYYLRKLEEWKDKEIMVDCPTDRTWTGAEIGEAVVTMAQALISDFGLKKGETVAFYCPNSDYHFIGQIAVIAAGGVYTGSFATNPYEELLFCVNSSDAVFLVASPQNLNVALQVARDAPAIRHVFVTEETRSDLKHVVPFCQLLRRRAADTVKIPVDVALQDTAALFYSSGTTGRPKVVIRTHRNQIQTAVQSAHPSLSYCDKDDVVPVRQPLCHMGGVIVSSCCISVGSKMLIMPGFYVEKYLSWGEKYEMTIAGLNPSHAVLITKYAHLGHYKLPFLKEILVGGGLSPPGLAEKCIEKLNASNYRQTLGMTEIGMGTIAPKNTFKFNSVGVPVPGVSIQVCDPFSGVCLEANQVGELCIKSDQVTPGYYQNEEATKATFTESGYLKTGDAGFYDEQGFIYIIDRYKEVIKVDCQQVAPIELEGLLTFHEDVAEVAVVGIPHEVHGQVPRAYVVLKPGAQADATTLIDYVGKQVADWKRLRGGLRFVDKLPKTSALDKIDRNKLKSMASTDL